MINDQDLTQSAPYKCNGRFVSARCKTDFRETNVRAASMYQASGVEQFAPGRHGYPRASDGPRDRNGGRVSDIAPAMAAKPVSRTITSRLASNSSCAWACSVL